MFDIGWTEMLVVVCVAIIVVGPKDLPKVLRGFGRAMKTVRGLAGDFQKQFEEAVKDAELDDVKNIATGKGFKPLEDIKKSASDFQRDVKAEMEARSKEIDEAMADKPKGLPQPVADKLAEMDAKAKDPVEKEAANPSGAEKTQTAKAPAQKKSTVKPAAKAAAKPASGKASASKSATRKPAAKKATKSA